MYIEWRRRNYYSSARTLLNEISRKNRQFRRY